MRTLLLVPLLSLLVALSTLAQQPDKNPPPHPIKPPKPDTGPCLIVEWELRSQGVTYGYRGSCVCVHGDGKKSVAVTNNHVLSVQPHPGAPFPLGNYPLEVNVLSLDKKNVWKGVAVAGDADADLAVIVVDGPLTFGKLADRNAAVGAEVWHKGIGSGFALGKVLPYAQAGPSSRFASTLRSMPGDSGAGVFDRVNGTVIGVNCGRHAMPEDAPQRGVAVEDVRAFLKKCSKLTGFNP